MRVAIVHYWLLKMRGGEKVVEALCRLFPAAELFTLFYNPEQVSPIIRERKVTPSFLNRLRGCYRSLLPLMPMALEHFDLRGYDLVITSESGPAKGVLVPSAARHICYCHTPMRYLWELYPAYLHEWTQNSIKRAMMAPLANYLRLWDYASAARVDTFIANSETVKRRIWRTYRRNSEVIHPPVSVETFYWRQPEDYFLVVSELSPYKRLDTAVRAFSHAGKRLRIVGTGPEYRTLRRMAGPSIEFCGWVPDDQLRELYSRSRALVVPGKRISALLPWRQWRAESQSLHLAAVAFSKVCPFATLLPVFSTCIRMKRTLPALLRNSRNWSAASTHERCRSMLLVSRSRSFAHASNRSWVAPNSSGGFVFR